MKVSQAVKLLVVALPQPSQQSRADCKQISSLGPLQEQCGQIFQKWVPTGSREKVHASISGQEGRKLTAEGLAVKWNSLKGSCRIILKDIFPSFPHLKWIQLCMFCGFWQRSSERQLTSMNMKKKWPCRLLQVVMLFSELHESSPNSLLTFRRYLLLSLSVLWGICCTYVWSSEFHLHLTSNRNKLNFSQRVC